MTASPKCSLQAVQQSYCISFGWSSSHFPDPLLSSNLQTVSSTTSFSRLTAVLANVLREQKLSGKNFHKHPPSQLPIQINWAFSLYWGNAAHISSKGQPSPCALDPSPSHVLKDTHPHHISSLLFSTDLCHQCNKNTALSTLFFPF